MRVGYALDVKAKMSALTYLTSLREKIFLLLKTGRSMINPQVFVSWLEIHLTFPFLIILLSHVQKVFPEAAAAAGHNQDHNGLPS